ncbi:putative RNA-binding protein 18 [Vanrija pseudolonga]|uniref:Probable RNA-binding protein 18 n=1 Tax=Vanrija pseudolonga TaxID=143232 RepID=A0AAF0Y904_9TREE|nr:putative RNA-binding protein 18 [Vanrija pseudolonga]
MSLPSSSLSRPSASASASQPAASGSGKPERLFVGNLAPAVDEYTLVQVFSKFGKITKLDLMIHKSGPLKGKPRGYAFIEFASQDAALKALVKLHDRLLRGRKLVVTYANAAPPEDLAYPKSRRVGEAAKPTTLSLLKSRQRPQSAAAQIAAMEAKLATMAQRPGRSPTPERAEAEALEAEIQRELALGAEAAASASAGASAETSAEPSPLPDDARLPADNPDKPDTDGAAPPKSTSTSPPPRSAPDTSSSRAGGARTEPFQSAAFQRGLASLPKKPTFS